jgi:cysteine synthase
MTPIYVEPVEIARVCRYLADRRDIRVGASSGAAVAAFLLAAQSNSLAHCGRSVVICPDSADGYIKTLFDDDWLIANNLGKAILGP